MEYVLGIILGSISISFANLVRESNRELFYAFILMLVGLTYVGFAYYPKTQPNLYIEIFIALGFFVIAVTGYCKGLWFVVGGLVVHALYSVYHTQLFPLTHLPTWWQPFSYAFDITLAFWLAAIAARSAAGSQIVNSSNS